jgi:ferredoxin-thioredoxin reductase catalytic subunit
METHQQNLSRLQQIATQRGLRLTQDAARLDKVVGLMARNFDAIQEWVCPCKQKNKPPVQGADITCPCPTLDAEIAASGMCHCRLFVRA